MRIKNLPSIESMDGSQDALVIEQTDGSEDKSRKVSPAQIKQYVLNDMDEVPTQNSNNPVKSGGIFSTMAVPKYDSANRREYYEGGAAFDGNIDSSPTAGSNNAVASGGTKTYVDNAVSELNDAISSLTSGKATYIPFGTITASSVPEAIGKAWDSITVYDRPVIVSFAWGGAIMAMMYKYSGSQYGMAIAIKYYSTDFYTMSVNNGIKTYATK